MQELENDLMQTWIYSYLRYYEAVTPEQRAQSKKDFLEYMLEMQKEGDRLNAKASSARNGKTSKK
jgi:hypothetical protein